MTDGLGTTQYSYVPVGSPGALQLAQDNGPYANDSITHGYDALGRITSTSVGTNTNTQTHTYDSLGRVTNKTNPLGSFIYQYLGDSGQVTSQQLAGGMDTVYRYGDNTQDRRLKAIMNQPSIKTKPSDGSAPRDWRYHSTAENLILGRKSNPGQPQGLHYDDAYRLIGTTQGLALGTTLGEDEFVSDGTVGTPNPGNWRSGYAYDAADNLTQASSETNPAGNWIATPNALNQISSKGGNSWVYDAAGNLLDDGNRTYEWDAQQRLIAITDKATGRKSEFIYDGNSRLTITKEYPAGSSTASETRYLWFGHKVCQSRDGQDNVTARYFDEGEIKAGQALYYTKDHLGSIMETTQASGKVLGSLDYGPYGEPEKAQGQLPDFRYAGMLHHAPTGLYLTHYRAYDPTVGRWLNRDPIEEQGGINLYGYVGGNPVSYIDPLGLDRWGDQPGFQWSVKSGVPLPKGDLYIFTVCLQTCYGSSLILTSTHEPYKGHGPGTAHGDSAALDLRYSALGDPEKVLCCAAKCKARYALDESKKPSKHSSAPHFHIELSHPRNKNWSKGDLPKDGGCKKC